MIFKIKFLKLTFGTKKLIRCFYASKSPWTTHLIRKNFFEYFLKNDHIYVDPSSVINKNYGSYFINSGVCQFRNLILGYDTKFNNISTAVNSQRCIRLGGKKCDLEHVGYDSTHLSYFEMLGNWSFRKYDKRAACTMMWKYLTEVLQLPQSHLYVTYYGGNDKLGLPPDDETRDIWFNLGVKDTKILQFEGKHNFWEMGERSTDPLCGPCTEIHWDYFATFSDSENPRCARCFVNSNSPEVIELWNCVFIQYQWSMRGSKLIPLPGLVIDTGMGLERLASILQSVTNVYDTDNFSKVIQHIGDISHTSKYSGTFDFRKSLSISCGNSLQSEKPSQIEELNLRRDVAYRIIADHLRTLCISVFDGILPGRQNVELKIRHLLHRAIRQLKYGLGVDGGLSPVIDTVCDTLRGQVEVSTSMRNAIKKLVDKEERNFLPKLELYEKTFQNFLGTRKSDDVVINDNEVGQLLSDKFGHEISLNMIKAMAKDAGLQVSRTFELDESIKKENIVDGNDDTTLSVYIPPHYLLELRQIPATQNRFMYNYVFNEKINQYQVDDLETEIVLVLSLSDYRNIFGNKDDKFSVDTKSHVNTDLFGLVTSHTNMFPIKGGQDCDKGFILQNDKNIANVFKVVELKSGHIIHWCKPTDSSKTLSLGRSSKVRLRVDSKHRTGTILHHTAHHIVFSGINNIVGRINQLSSSVKFDGSRFYFNVDLSHGNSNNLQASDFSEKLEQFCNEIIKKHFFVDIKENVNFSEIIKDETIRYVQSDQYPAKVRLISFGESNEICCGTHAHNTAHLQCIIITSLKRVNQAVSEISFVTGEKAVKIQEKQNDYLKLCDKISHQDYWLPEDIDMMLKKLNRILSSELLSKSVRNEINKSIIVLLRKKNKLVSTITLLKYELDKCNENSSDVCIINSKITRLSKIMQTLIDISCTLPVIIYEDNKIFVYVPDIDVMKVLSNCLENLGNSRNEYDIDTPEVKNFSQDILRQFAILNMSIRSEKPGEFIKELKQHINVKMSVDK